MCLDAESCRSTESRGEFRVSSDSQHVQRHPLDVMLCDEEARFTFDDDVRYPGVSGRYHRQPRGPSLED